MKKAKHDPPSETTANETANENTHDTPGNGQDLHRERNGAAGPGPAAGDVVQQATNWVQENQQLALLGAFGVGVFIGVLLRK